MTDDVELARQRIAFLIGQKPKLERRRIPWWAVILVGLQIVTLALQ